MHFGKIIGYTSTTGGRAGSSTALPAPERFQAGDGRGDAPSPEPGPVSDRHGAEVSSNATPMTSSAMTILSGRPHATGGVEVPRTRRCPVFNEEVSLAMPVIGEAMC